MKKYIIISAMLILTACGTVSAPEENSSVSETEVISESPDTAGSSEAEQTAEAVVPKQYVMVNDLLYENTGEISHSLRCGMTDGRFSDIVPENELPQKNGQANFSGSQGWQYGESPNTIEVCFRDEWYIFTEADEEYEREDIGVSMSVKDPTSAGLTAVFSTTQAMPADGLSSDRSHN